MPPGKGPGQGLSTLSPTYDLTAWQAAMAPGMFPPPPLPVEGPCKQLQGVAQTHKTTWKAA